MIASGADGDIRHVIGFLMAMSNTYGIIVITVLLGSGLVAFPRLLWSAGFPHAELTKIYLIAELVESSFQETRYSLEDCELEVRQVAQKQSVKDDLELSKFVFLLQNEVAEFEFPGRAMSRRFTGNSGDTSRSNGDGIRQDVDKAFLVSLNARLKQAQMRVRAAEKKWKSLVLRATKLEVSLCMMYVCMCILYMYMYAI